MDAATEGACMPLGSPPYEAPPYPAGRRASLLLVSFDADFDALKREIPEPFEPIEDRPCVAWVFEAPQLTGGSYFEGALLCQVRYRDIEGMYVPYIWGDVEELGFLNRELYGWPELTCDPAELERTGNSIRGRVVRRGEELLTVTGFLERKSDGEGIPLLPDWLQLRKFPNPMGGPPSLRQVVHLKIVDEEVHELWEGRGMVELGASAQFNTGPLRPLRVHKAWYMVTSFTLPAATAVWDV